MAWTPKRIDRYGQACNTANGPVIVETDLGLAYAKGISVAILDKLPPPQKQLARRFCLHGIAGEVLAWVLARHLGVSIPDAHLVRVPADPIANRWFEPGPLFLSRAVEGAATLLIGRPAASIRLTNPDAVPRMIALDSLVRNCDRFAPPPYNHRNPNAVQFNRRNLLFAPMPGAGRDRWKLFAIDHGHIIANGDPWTTELLNDKSRVTDERNWGMIPGLNTDVSDAHVADACDSLRALTRRQITDAVESIPLECGLSVGVRIALIEFLVARASFLGGVLDGWINQFYCGRLALEADNEDR